MDQSEFKTKSACVCGKCCSAVFAFFFISNYEFKALFNHSLYISSWKANGFYARGSVIASKIAPPSKGSGSYNSKHSKLYKFCKISD